MRHPDTEHQIERLEAEFDRKIAEFEPEHSQKVEEIRLADSIGRRAGRGGFYTWFDRKTRYQILPKIAIGVFLMDLSLLIACFTTPLRAFLGDNIPFLGLLFLSFVAAGFYSLFALDLGLSHLDLSNDIYFDPVNKGYSCNAWRKSEKDK